MHGEYILLGRKTVDKGDWLIQYGYYPFQETRTLNITKGAGLQNGICESSLTASKSKPS
jgi:hypothetical protein